MSDLDALKTALYAARSAINSSPFDATAALQAVRQLSALCPRHVAVLASKTEQAVGAAMGQSSNYDSLAIFAMTRLVEELERTLFRSID